MDSPTVESITRALLASFDPEHVGKDDHLRFSYASLLRLFLHRYRTTGDASCRQAVERTLDELSANQPQKLSSEGTPGQRLSDNSAMLELYAWAYLVMDRETYLETAGLIGDYIQQELSNESDLPTSDGAPSVARVAATASLLDAAWLLNRPDYLASGLAVLETVLTQISDGTLQWNNPASENTEDGAFIESYTLSIDALAKGYAQTGQTRFQAAARQLADGLISLYRPAEEGSQLDGNMGNGWSSGSTSAFALGLAWLFNQTFLPEYQRAALGALEKLGPVDPQIGVTAGTYALALDLLLHPSVEVTVVGVAEASSTRQLLRSASTIPYPNVNIKYIDSGDQERMEDAGYVSGGDAQAYVCMNSLCLAPVSDPETLHSTVSDFLKPADPMAGDMIQSLEKFILSRRSSRGQRSSRR